MEMQSPFQHPTLRNVEREIESPFQWQQQLQKIQSWSQKNNLPVGGKLQYFATMWEQIIQNAWAVQIIQEGLKMKFLEEPKANSVEEYYLNNQDNLILEKEVKVMLQSKLAIEECYGEKGIVSPLFVIPKPGGKKRPVWDGTHINSYLVKEHFKMESLLTVRELLKRGDFMCTIDIKDAYFHIPIHQEFRNYLQFRWKGKLYRFRCLPFGISIAPRVFTKLMRTVVERLRLMNIRLVIFIDDILVIGHSKEQCQQDSNKILKMLITLGWTINWEKSNLIPTQTIQFLGMKIDSHNMLFKVPREKLKSIKKDIEWLLNRKDKDKSITLRQLARVIGKLVAIELAILPMRLKTWKLQHCKNTQLKATWEGKIKLTAEAVEELKWWENNLEIWNGKAIILGPPKVTITTDASGTGWGAVCMEKTAQGLWSMLERNYGNNILEFMAGGFGVQSFETETTGKVVLLQMDNTTAISYINKMGGRKEQLCNIAQEIWEWCIQRNTFLIASHIPGEDNIKADQLSRAKFIKQDWKLNPEIFSKLEALWGPYKIDLFASRLNKQVEDFFSWHPEPGSKGIDAFKQSRKNQKALANPPFNLIGKVLSKVQQEKASITLITPLWPTQHWFPVVMKLAVTWPILLPNRRDLFLPGFLENQIPYQHANWRAIAWNISGNQKFTKEFQKEFSNLLQKKEENLPKLLMTMDGECLLNGGMNKISLIEIFHHLN